MADFLEKVFGLNARSVRRNFQERVTVDQQGEDLMEPTAGEAISLSEEGSIDHVVLVNESFYHCGCSATNLAGGHCAEPGCRQVSCQRCFQNARCIACDKPLCLEHTCQFADPEGRINRFCRRCYNEVSRRRFAKKVVLGFPRPFHEDFKRLKR